MGTARWWRRAPTLLRGAGAVTFPNPPKSFQTYVGEALTGLFIELRSFRMSMEDSVKRAEDSNAAQHNKILRQIEQTSDYAKEARDLAAQLANQPALQARLNALASKMDEDSAALDADDPAAPPAEPQA
jgi:hypothetical protein